MIRKATPADVPAITRLAVEAVSQDDTYKALRVSRDRISTTAEVCVSAADCFAWVNEDSEGIQAAVIAETSPGFWFERHQSTVLMFYSRKPGMGVPLLREYARWVKGRPTIKMAVFALEPGADPRIGLLLQRLGFAIPTPGYTYVRSPQ